VRAVADTNTVVSGLLWQGAPRQVLDAARAGKVDLFTSAVLLAELEDVLRRDKFAERLQRASVTAHGLTIGYAALARPVEPAAITPVILEDPDDDAVLACAIAAQVEIIVSGDSHLLNLKAYQDIPILSVVELLARVPNE
jgi:putative PIN family toxin of toxin-antitoxin system